MEVFVGCDHAGYKLKQAVKQHLEEKGHKIVDLGTFNEEPADYPVIAREIAEKIQEHPEAMGVMICGTGQGSAMALNRHKKVRAALALQLNLQLKLVSIIMQMFFALVNALLKNHLL